MTNLAKAYIRLLYNAASHTSTSRQTLGRWGRHGPLPFIQISLYYLLACIAQSCHPVEYYTVILNCIEHQPCGLNNTAVHIGRWILVHVTIEPRIMHLEKDKHSSQIHICTCQAAERADATASLSFNTRHRSTSQAESRLADEDQSVVR
jgi:hypothetical protein